MARALFHGETVRNDTSHSPQNYPTKSVSEICSINSPATKWHDSRAAPGEFYFFNYTNLLYAPAKQPSMVQGETIVSHRETGVGRQCTLTQLRSSGYGTGLTGSDSIR